MNNKLISFYRNESEGPGFTLEQIWKWDNNQLEQCHDYIQWLFPLKEPSAYNPNAPLLDEDTIIKFIYDSDPERSSIMDNIWHSFKMIKIFLSYPNRDKPIWLESNNHNMLRITRIITFIKCISCYGEYHYDDQKDLYEKLSEFYNWLDYLDHAFPGNVSDETWNYWRKAFHGV